MSRTVVTYNLDTIPEEGMMFIRVGEEMAGILRDNGFDKEADLVIEALPESRYSYIQHGVCRACIKANSSDDDKYWGEYKRNVSRYCAKTIANDFARGYKKNGEERSKFQRMADTVFAVGILMEKKDVPINVRTIEPIRSAIASGYIGIDDYDINVKIG